jgi:predicted transcriptional regulator
VHIVKKGKGDPEEFLNKLFGSVTRARILCFLFALPGQSFYQRQIMYETGLSLRPVQRELNNLFRLGIIKKQTTRTRVYYGIDADSPFFKPLKAICGALGER